MAVFLCWDARSGCFTKRNDGTGCRQPIKAIRQRRYVLGCGGSLVFNEIAGPSAFDVVRPDAQIGLLSEPRIAVPLFLAGV